MSSMGVSKKYTVADIENSEDHIELINGEKIIIDRTNSDHNELVNEIVFALKSYIKANGGSCKVFSENVALYVNELCDDDGMFFLPDVMLVCDPGAVDSKGVHKAPGFVAEITSESTRKYDYNEKLDIYKKIGVEEYWIVDIQRKTVYKYLASEDYVPQTYMRPESMKVSVCKGLMIDISGFMA
jgi:Uma2 family endonuclease